MRDSPLESAPLGEIVRAAAEQDEDPLFNAAAQAWNQDFYWRSMGPGGGGDACGDVAQLIEDRFGSQKAFRRADYVAAVLGNLLNWNFANENLARSGAAPMA